MPSFCQGRGAPSELESGIIWMKLTMLSAGHSKWVCKCLKFSILRKYSLIDLVSYCMLRLGLFRKKGTRKNYFLNLLSLKVEFSETFFLFSKLKYVLGNFFLISKIRSKMY